MKTDQRNFTLDSCNETREETKEYTCKLRYTYEEVNVTPM